MRRLSIALIVGAIALTAFASSAAALGQQSFRIRVGVFQPQGDSSYWIDSQDVFYGDIGEFDDDGYRRAAMHAVEHYVKGALTLAAQTVIVAGLDMADIEQ